MRRRLKDTVQYSSLFTTGFIFKKIQASYSSTLEWLTSDMAQSLDEKLILEHSGDKKISNYYGKLLELEEDSTIADALQIVAKNIVLTYTDKWNKLHSAMISSDYNPLENYDMEQVETPDVTKEKTVDVKTKMVTSSSGDSSSGVYGFNSPTSVPSTENEANTEVTVEGNNLDNVSHDLETETGTRELTRHGNIGVTTSQQMLESEIQLRSNNNFVLMLLNDVSKVLCISVY